MYIETESFVCFTGKRHDKVKGRDKHVERDNNFMRLMKWIAIIRRRT